MKEGTAVKDYLNYVRQRVVYLRILNNGIPSNEYRWYCAMRSKLYHWGEKHKVFYQLLRGKINADKAMDLCGVHGRTFWRMISKQRKELIAFITESEKQLDEKYPFIPVADFFDVEGEGK